MVSALNSIKDDTFQQCLVIIHLNSPTQAPRPQKFQALVPQHFKQLDFAAEPVPSPVGGPLAAASWQIMPLQAGTTCVPEGQSLAKPAELFLPTSLPIISIWLTTSSFSTFLEALLWDVTLPTIGSPSKTLYTEYAYRKEASNWKRKKKSFIV